tara:strand:+ start:212 stop:769 length:558 start_codon:yes stop_codon:yes gene_type:complete
VDGPHLYGQAALDLRWAFEQVIGPDAVERAIASLPPTEAQRYRQLTPLSWIDYETTRRVNDALARESGQTVDELFAKAIPMAVERSFSTVWRMLIRLTTDKALIARTPLIYRRTRSHGEMRAEVLGRGEARVQVTGFPEIPDRDVMALGLSIRSLLGLAGRKSVTVDGRRSPDGATWTVRWDRGS